MYIYFYQNSYYRCIDIAAKILAIFIIVYSIDDILTIVANSIADTFMSKKSMTNIYQFFHS